MVLLSDSYYIYYEIRGICTSDVYDDHINSVDSVNSVYINDNNVNMTRKRTRTMTRRNLTRNINTCMKGWSWKTLDEENFCSALAWYTPEVTDMITNDTIDPNVISQKLKQILADAADFLLPKGRNVIIKPGRYTGGIPVLLTSEKAFL